MQSRHLFISILSATSNRGGKPNMKLFSVQTNLHMDLPKVGNSCLIIVSAKQIKVRDAASPKIGVGGSNLVRIISRIG